MFLFDSPNQSSVRKQTRAESFFLAQKKQVRLMQSDGSVEHSRPTLEMIDQASVADPDALKRSLIKSITEFERSFRKNYPMLWVTTLVGPLLVTITILVFIGLVWGWGLASKFVTAAFITFFFLGRFVILGGDEGQAMGWMEKVALAPSQLFFMVTYMDFMVALFVTFHMGVLFRLPWVGPKLATLVSDGKFIMDHHPWIKRLALVGLIVFVVFPTSTTGSIGGSIFGRLLGLGRFFTVAGVLLGSIIGNGIMYLFAKEINKYIGPDSLWLKFAGIILLIIGFLYIEWRYRQTKKKYLSKARPKVPEAS